MEKIKRILIYLIFFTVFSSSIFSSTWAILPVKFENFKSSFKMSGPAINPDDPHDGWETAKLFKIYLNSNYVYTVLPVDEVKKAYSNNKLGLNANLGQHDLQKISADIDADKLLLTRIIYSPQKFTIVLQTYYTQSNILGESVSFSGDDLFYIMGEALKNHFSIKEEVFSKNQERLDFIFAIDASGKNYQEISNIPELIKNSDINSFSAVSIDGYGKTFTLKNTGDQSIIYDYINHIKPQSTDSEGKIYPKMLEEVIQLTQKNKSHIIFLFVAGAPSDIDYRQKTNAYIRKLSQKYHLIIFGNGKLSHNDRNYWSSLSTIHKNLHYIDILYSIQAGMSDGNPVYIIKSGDKLYESNIDEIENAHEIELSIDQRNALTPENMVKTFEDAVYRQSVSRRNVKIKYYLNPVADLLQFKTEKLTEKKIKVLITMSGKPFWIKIPYYQTGTGYSNVKLNENDNYFFLLNLIEGGYGIPLRNTASFGRVLDPGEVSKIIILDIDKYLKNTQNYLRKSLGGSSLYILYGKVKEIQYEKKILY